MFTGLVQAKGKIVDASMSRGGLRLAVVPLSPLMSVLIPGKPPVRTTPQHGDSICVSGCCLTVSRVQARARNPVLQFEVVEETLSKTTIGAWRKGDVVNLEPAATLATFMGGHLVQGHVDGVGRVLHVTRDSKKAGWGKHRIRIQSPSGLARYLAPKGSVCVDGVSLTIASLSSSGGGWFEVALIPTTLQQTTLGALEPEVRVNLEMDIISKTVVGWLESRENARSRPRRGRRTVQRGSS